MRKLITLASFLFACFPVFADGDGKVSLKPYGFVENQMFLQNRSNYQAVDGLLNFIPKDKLPDAEGHDLNEGMNSRMIAINTRLGVRFQGPDMLGANSTALFEGDFSTAGMCFFLRQGYIQLDWETDRVLFGQTGHPMCTDLMPGTINIAIGSPFNALNRSPMLRYDHLFLDDKSLDLTLAAIYQFYSGISVGPNGKSNEYQTNSCVPELWLGLKYSNNGFSVETGVDCTNLTPRVVNSNNVKVSERICSPSALLQASYNTGKLSLRAKTVYGYDMTHLNMAGGYGVSAINADGSYEYAGLKQTSSWIFASYGSKWRVGFFAGFMKNLGADKDLIDTDKLLWVYNGAVNNIDMMYRFCPQLEFNVSNMSLGMECELTNVAYGNTVEKRGTVTDTYNVTNYRLFLSAKYSF